MESKKRIKILQCPVYYLPNRIGGIEVYVHSLNRCLRKRGYDVKVLVPDYPGEKPYGEEFEGIPVLTYTEHLNATREEFQGKIPGKGLAAFKKVLEQEKPDIIHFHQFTSSNGVSVFHLQVAKELGIKVFYTNHLVGLTCQTSMMVYRDKIVCDGIIRVSKCAVCDLKKHHVNEPLSWALVQTGRLVSGLIPAIKKTSARPVQFLLQRERIIEKKEKVKRMLQLTDRFIAITDWYYKVLEKNGFDLTNVRVIRQGLPLNNTGIIERKKFQTCNKVLRVVFVGRVYPDKGLHILLNAVNKLSKAQVTVDIFGQVNDAAYFDKCKKIFEGKSNITFHGHINGADIVTEMIKYDVLVLPSMIAEMAPLVIKEAFAAGIPVVGTNIGGIAEEIQDGYNGFLFGMGNVNQLASILEMLIEDNTVLPKIAANIKTPPTFEIVADQVEAEYLSIL